MVAKERALGIFADALEMLAQGKVPECGRSLEGLDSDMRLAGLVARC